MAEFREGLPYALPIGVRLFLRILYAHLGLKAIVELFRLCFRAAPCILLRLLGSLVGGSRVWSAVSGCPHVRVWSQVCKLDQT